MIILNDDNITVSASDNLEDKVCIRLLNSSVALPFDNLLIDFIRRQAVIHLKELFFDAHSDISNYSGADITMCWSPRVSSKMPIKRC